MLERMTRMRRSFEQRGWFHVTNRGVDRQDIFTDSSDCEMFLNEVELAVVRHGVEVHAYSLMSNHFHLVLHCPDGALSDFMQQVLQRFAIRHNLRVERVGHLFSGRFRSTVIEEESADATAAFTVWSRYVHRNPLDRLVISELATDPFSSYGAYLGVRSHPVWLTTSRLLGCHHNDVAALRRFTESPHVSDTTPVSGQEVTPPAPVEVLAAVASATGVKVDELLNGGRGRPNAHRALAAHLAYRLRSASTEQLAEVFGLNSQSAFRRLAARGKDEIALNPRLESAERRARRILQMSGEPVASSPSW